MSGGMTHGDGLFEDSAFLNFFLNNKFDFDSSGMWFSPNKWRINKSDLGQGSFQFFDLITDFYQNASDIFTYTRVWKHKQERNKINPFQ